MGRQGPQGQHRLRIASVGPHFTPDLPGVGVDTQGGWGVGSRIPSLRPVNRRPRGEAGEGGSHVYVTLPLSCPLPSQFP